MRGDGERLLDRDGDRDLERERDLLRETLRLLRSSGERLRERLLDRLRLRLRLRESLGGPGLSYNVKNMEYITIFLIKKCTKHCHFLSITVSLQVLL